MDLWETFNQTYPGANLAKFQYVTYQRKDWVRWNYWDEFFYLLGEDKPINEFVKNFTEDQKAQLNIDLGLTQSTTRIRQEFHRQYPKADFSRFQFGSDVKTGNEIIHWRKGLQWLTIFNGKTIRNPLINFGDMST